MRYCKSVGIVLMILTVTVAIAERRWKTALSPANMRIAKEPTIVKINVRRLKILSIISLTSQVKIPNRLFAFYWVYCRLRSARLYALSLVWCLAKSCRKGQDKDEKCAMFCKVGRICSKISIALTVIFAVLSIFVGLILPLFIVL